MRLSRIIGSFLLIFGVAGLPLVTPPVASAANFTLTVTKTSGGSVSSSPAGINCGFDCNQSYLAGTNVGLTATANAGYRFAGWSGACTGTGACSVTMNSAKSVQAAFAPIPKYTLTVSPRPTGGSIVSNPAGINCGATCSKEFAEGTVVTLTATPSSGKVLTGWGGACSGTQKTCTVTMNSAKTVSATFGAVTTTTTTPPPPPPPTTTTTVPPPPTTTTTTTTTTSTTTQATTTTTAPPGPGVQLSVTKIGDGAGTVTSAPAGIDCGATCSAQFGNPTTVTLTATPAPGQAIVGWSAWTSPSGVNECTGQTATCTITVDKARTVVAHFDDPGIGTVEIMANGQGSWTSELVGGGIVRGPGIECVSANTGQSGDCSEKYALGTTITLTLERDANTESAFFQSPSECTSATVCTFTLTKSYSAEWVDVFFCPVDCAMPY